MIKRYLHKRGMKKAFLAEVNANEMEHCARLGLPFQRRWRRFNILMEELRTQEILGQLSTLGAKHLARGRAIKKYR